MSTFSSVSVLTNLVIVCFLVQNWFFALSFMVRGSEAAHKSEKRMKLTFWSLVVLLLTFTICFGIVRVVLSETSAFWSVAGFRILSAIVHFASLMLCLALVSCAIVGAVLLKRRAAAKHIFIGVLRMIGVSVLLLVVTVFRFAYFFLVSFVWIPLWILPEWFEYGIVFIFVPLVQQVALLYFVSVASKNLSLRLPSSIELSSAAKSLLDSNNHVESPRKVPLAYDI